MLEVCLAIITITLVAISIVMLKGFLQARRTIRAAQADFHNLTTQATQLISSLQHFVQSDLHEVSGETSHLIGQLNNLSTDICNKTQSLNFLFNPLKSFNNKRSAESSGESSLKNSTLPQILKWAASSLFLIKAIKEVIKK